MVKVAVYAIALNEEQFVERWYESAKDADYILIADTGSTDRTVELATSLGINVINVSISPWRFDDARNSALHALPIDVDYCIALDMDEVLLPGWKKKLLKAHKNKVTRPRYKYTWSWKEDGTPGLEYGGDKIHARKGYRWKHPVHEVIITDRLDEIQGWVDLEIHHYPDNSKSRGQYFPLLEVAIKEDPYDDRNAFYYARELFFYGKLDEAAKEFKRHLSLPKAVWKPERSASYRYLAKCEPQEAVGWLQRAALEDPTRRESWVSLALEFYNQKNWVGCYEMSLEALNITTKPLDYLCEEFAWNEIPYDLAAISSYHLGNKELALEYGTKAVELAPTDERLKNNLIYYSE
jgi:glycosyltransferase involved in cell wall biosynthesis